MPIENLFEDVSIFQGVREFNTPSGMMRFEVSRGGPVHAYLLEGGAFVHKGSFILRSGEPTNEKLYGEFLAMDEKDEMDL